LASLLAGTDIEIVAEAANGKDAVRLAQKDKPDVILMDIRMPVCNGLTATRLIKAEMPDVKIIMLTTSNEDQDLFEAVKSGANGYLLKSMDAESLIEALDDAELDIPPFAPGLAVKLLAEFARTAQQASAEAAAGEPSSGEVGAAAPMPSRALETEEALTPRQAEVLGLIAQGLSYKEVGARVYLSPRTVKYHMAEIMRKLHLQNRAQVLAYANAATRAPTEEPR
jgi:DNA-binding NarL/FixJ family response regulator